MFMSEGVVIYGDDIVVGFVIMVIFVIEEDWEIEYLSFDVVMKVVDLFDDVFEYICCYSIGYIELIIMIDVCNVECFFVEVDLVVVMVNVLM